MSTLIKLSAIKLTPAGLQSFSKSSRKYTSLEYDRDVSVLRLRVRNQYHDLVELRLYIFRDNCCEAALRELDWLSKYVTTDIITSFTSIDYQFIYSRINNIFQAAHEQGGIEQDLNVIHNILGLAGYSANYSLLKGIIIESQLFVDQEHLEEIELNTVKSSSVNPKQPTAKETNMKTKDKPKIKTIRAFKDKHIKDIIVLSGYEREGRFFDKEKWKNIIYKTTVHDIPPCFIIYEQGEDGFYTIPASYLVTYPFWDLENRKYYRIISFVTHPLKRRKGYASILFRHLALCCRKEKQLGNSSEEVKEIDVIVPVSNIEAAKFLCSLNFPSPTILPGGSLKLDNEELYLFELKNVKDLLTV